MAKVFPSMRSIIIGSGKPSVVPKEMGEPRDCELCKWADVKGNNVTCLNCSADRRTDMYDGDIYCNAYEVR